MNYRFEVDSKTVGGDVKLTLTSSWPVPIRDLLQVDIEMVVIDALSRM